MGKVALVVDDAPFIRAEIKEILEEQGYKVYEAGDGLEAVTIYKMHNPDIVTMDVNMPKVHGLKATQIITEYDKNAKVMLCSTMMMFQIIRKWEKKLVQKPFLSKPFTDIEFMEELSKIICNN